MYADSSASIRARPHQLTSEDTVYELSMDLS